MKDLATGDVTLASTSDSGVKSNGQSGQVSLSADGTRVAFTSGATNLDPADTDALYDIYVKDLVSGDITLASTTDAGTTGNKGSYRPAVSGDGTAVAFWSYATNLDPADTDDYSDVYVKNLDTGDLLLASSSDSGMKGNTHSGINGLGISADGSRVAFESQATNLDPADSDIITNNIDIYVKDLTTSDITLASTSDAGVLADRWSFEPTLSASGTRVGFNSQATNLDSADTDSTFDVYVKDLVTGDIMLASTSDSGVKGNSTSGYSVRPSRPTGTGSRSTRSPPIWIPGTRTRWRTCT